MALTETEEALLREILVQKPELDSLADNEAAIIAKLANTKIALADLTAAVSVVGTDLTLVVQDGTAKKSTVGTLIAAIGTYGSAKIYGTYAAAAAASHVAGDAVIVFGDAGTHTDPVVGGIVDNEGIYIYSASPAGLEWVAPVLSQSIIDAVIDAEASAAAALASANLAESFATVIQELAVGVVYTTTAGGIAGTINGEYFSVWADERIRNYLNDAGVAVFQNELATSGLLSTYAVKANLPANVADYGASPAASAAANVTAFQTALDTGRAVFIPGGTYRLNAKLTSTGKAVAITTDGAAILKWVTGSATQGLDFTFSNLTTHTLSIGDIELVTECEGGGSAIKAVWPVGASGFNRLWQLGKIRIRGADIIAQDGFWDYGLDTTNGWLGYCETLDFYGQASGVTPLSTAAWVARGTSTDSRVHIRARYAKAMLLIAGFSEGLDISGSFAVACDYGVDCSGTSGLNTPGLVWIGGHASCFKGGVRSVNINQGNISDLLIYKRTDSAQNFIGFDLDSTSTEWQISDCKVLALGNPGGGTTTAIKDAGANNISVSMRAVGCNTDVNIVAGALGFQHSFSRSEGDRGVITQGSTSGQVTCLPGGSLGTATNYFDVLTANSATPSILGYRKWGSCGHILTASSVATTITDFTGGFPGDEFVLQANDANTTVQHSTGLQLNGAVNKVMASAETIRLRRVSSTAWKQI